MNFKLKIELTDAEKEVVRATLKNKYEYVELNGFRFEKDSVEILDEPTNYTSIKSHKVEVIKVRVGNSSYKWLAILNKDTLEDFYKPNEL